MLRPNAKCCSPSRRFFGQLKASREIGCRSEEVQWFLGATAKSRARELFSNEFEVGVKPDLRFVFALPGAERLPIACPTCAFQVLGIAPDTDCRGSGCVILVWLHVLSNGKPQ